MQADVGRKMVVEAVGVFALTFVGVGSILFGFGGGGLTTVALAYGLVVAAMVCAVRHVSGGHFNPAITFGFLVTRRISPADAVAYWVAQLGAAVLGALALKLALPKGTSDVDGGATMLASGVSVGSGFAIEFILTFLLMWVFFAVAVDPRSAFGPAAGIPVGLMIAAGVMAAGGLTGASMNPARTFGPALVGNVWSDAWVYFVACPLGAAAAALVYHHFVLAGRE
jgi:aquaporin TIP